MKLSIIKSDNAVYVDGVIKIINLSSITPSNFWALQWQGPDTGKGGTGEIEFSGSPKPVNQKITDLGNYYTYYQQWLAEPLPPPPTHIP